MWLVTSWGKSSNTTRYIPFARTLLLDFHSSFFSHNRKSRVPCSFFRHAAKHMNTWASSWRRNSHIKMLLRTMSWLGSMATRPTQTLVYYLHYASLDVIKMHQSDTFTFSVSYSFDSGNSRTRYTGWAFVNSYPTSKLVHWVSLLFYSWNDVTILNAHHSGLVLCCNYWVVFFTFIWLLQFWYINL